MKIGIPIDERSEDASMASRFGRALYYLIYNFDTKEYEYHENPSAMARGGAGVKASEFLVSQGVKAVIAPRVGPNAEQVLRASNIIIYEGQVEPWKNLIEKLEKNELKKV